MENKNALANKQSENEAVLQEFNLNEKDKDTISIYKLIGPVLAKQEYSEAVTNVKTRLDFMKKEVGRLDDLEKEFQGKCADKQKNIMTLQKRFQSEAQKFAA